MIRWLLFVLLLLAPACAQAQQVILTTKEQQSLKALMGTSGEIEQLIMKETATHPLSTAGHARLMVDSVTHTLLCSFNGGSYSACTGSGGVTSFNGLTGALTTVNDTNVTMTGVTLGWSGTLAASRGGLGSAAPTDDGVPVGSGSAWVTTVIPTCSAANSALTYNISTNAFGCNTISGTVTGSGATGNSTYWTSSSVLAGDTTEIVVVTSPVTRAGIQAAHDALPAGGGVVKVPASAVTLDSTTVTLSKPVVLHCAGPGATVITTAASIAFTLTSTGRITIENCGFILGAGTTGFSRSPASETLNATVFDNVWVSGGLVGVHFVTNAVQNKVVNSVFTGQTGVALKIENAANPDAGDNVVANSQIENAAIGIDVTAGGLRVVGNKFIGGGTYNIHAAFTGSGGLQIVGNDFGTADEAISITGTYSDISILGNLIAYNDTMGIRITGTTLSSDIARVTISGNVLRPTVDIASVGISLNKVSYVNVNGNQYQGTTGSKWMVIDTVTDTSITDNQWAVTSNSLAYAVASLSRVVIRDFNGLVFANLPAGLADGSTILCTDCSVADPAAGSGSGQFANRIAGRWVTSIDQTGSYTWTGANTFTNAAAALFRPHGVGAGNTSELRFQELAANGTAYVGFKGPDSIASSLIYVLPSISGTNGFCLSTDGGGAVTTLSWVACSGGGSGTITSIGGQSGPVITLTNDTNVTLTGSGNAVVAGWSGTLAASRGGFGADMSAASGVISFNAGARVVNNVLTATQILYGAASNTVGSSTAFTWNDSTKVLDTRGTMILSPNTGTLPSGAGAVLQLANANGSSTFALFDTFGVGDPILIFRRANGTVASKTIVTDTNSLGGIQGRGYDGANYSSAVGSVGFFVDGTWTAATSYPTGIAFTTTPTGSTTIAERGRITAAGKWLIGTSTAGSSLLKVAGSIESTTTGFVFPDATTQATAFSTGSNYAWTGTHTWNTQAAISLLPYGVSAGNTGEIRWRELAANGTNYVGFKAPDAIAVNIMWKLPIADGSADQCMKTDGSQQLGWVACSSGITGSGSNTQMTFWTGAATISGSSNLTWDNTVRSLAMAINGTPQAAAVISATGTVSGSRNSKGSFVTPPIYGGSAGSANVYVSGANFLVNDTTTSTGGTAAGSAVLAVRQVLNAGFVNVGIPIAIGIEDYRNTVGDVEDDAMGLAIYGVSAPVFPGATNGANFWPIHILASRRTSPSTSFAAGAFIQMLNQVVDLTVTGNTTSGSAVVTSVSPGTTTIPKGQLVSGTGIPTGTTVVSIDSSSQITLSNTATATNTGITIAVSAKTVGVAIAEGDNYAFSGSLLQNYTAGDAIRIETKTRVTNQSIEGWDNYFNAVNTATGISHYAVNNQGSVIANLRSAGVTGITIKRASSDTTGKYFDFLTSAGVSQSYLDQAGGLAISSLGIGENPTVSSGIVQTLSAVSTTAYRVKQAASASSGGFLSFQTSAAATLFSVDYTGSVGVNAGAGGVAGTMRGKIGTNGIDGIVWTRATDSAPTNNFLKFLQVDATVLFTVDVLGVVTAVGYKTGAFTGLTTTITVTCGVLTFRGGILTDKGAC